MYSARRGEPKLTVYPYEQIYAPCVRACVRGATVRAKKKEEKTTFNSTIRIYVRRSLKKQLYILRLL